VDTETDADGGSFSVTVDTTGWPEATYDITVTNQEDGKSPSTYSNALSLTVNPPAAIGVRSIGTVSYVEGLNSTLTPTYPGTIQAGDTLALFLFGRDATNTTWTPDQGSWSSLGRNATASNGVLEIRYAAASGSESGTLTITSDAPNEGTQFAIIVAFTNVHSSPSDATPVYQNITVNPIVHPGVTTASAGSAVILFTGKYQGVLDGTADYDSWTGLGGSLTELFDYSTNLGNNAAFGAAWGTATSSGATGNLEVTQQNTSVGQSGAFALKKA
jgi:hypothetical protein